MTPTLRRRALLAAASLPLVPIAARAQGDWPTRPVRVIVPLPPGQAADIFTRLVAEELSKRWPQQVVVENRAGGAGAPALEAGARSAPDGYTLITGTSGTLGVNPSVVRRLPYDAERDFAPISNIFIAPLVLVAHPAQPFSDAAGFAAAARAQPGALNCASAGPATAQHMAIELLMLRTGLRVTVVHYRGSGPGITDLIAGNVAMMMDSVASALPDVPTIAETLSPGYEAVGWSGLVAPAATPPAIVARISADVGAILRDPAMVRRIEETGAVADPSTPEQYAAFIRAEIAKWREVARAANVTL